MTKNSHLDLKGHLLLAMPGMEDSRFARTVILICSHSDEGSMGFILNQPVASPTFVEILEELEMDKQSEFITSGKRVVPIFRGGPVEQGRGFVIHSMDYASTASARIGDVAAVTATLEALRVLASDNPPEHATMLLGYAGWADGQLEGEIAQNGWLTTPATHELVFETKHAELYDAALATMGINEALLSASAGHA